MRKILISLIMTVMLSPSAVLAGAAGGGGGNPMDKMAERLGLSQEQQAEIEKIIQTQREKQQALRQQTQKDVNEVLTADQRKQLQEIQQQRQQQMRKRLEDMKKQRGEGAGGQ